MYTGFFLEGKVAGAWH